MLVRGSLDVVTATEMRGWAFSPGRKDPVIVQAVLNHEIVGESVANLHRPDLAVAGLGDGNSGYLIKLFRPIDPLYLPFIVVKVDGGDAELPRAPTVGFAEFFAALHRAHPAAGRPRSVFGGLWTDRTDAPALLRGKTEIGQFPPEAAAAAGQLVHSGVAVLDLLAHPAEGFAATNEAIAALLEDPALAALLEDPALLPLLRGVLEDNPVVVRGDVLGAGATPFAQPSAANRSPSPAECLALVVPLGDGVCLDVVRDSHRLPEFTPDGASRWVSGDAADGVSLATTHGLLERYVLPPGTVAVVGSGMVCSLRVASEGGAARLLCVPARAMPVALAAEGRSEFVNGSGVRVWMP